LSSGANPTRWGYKHVAVVGDKRFENVSIQHDPAEPNTIRFVF
jgi:hypothetical protein